MPASETPGEGSPSPTALHSPKPKSESETTSTTTSIRSLIHGYSEKRKAKAAAKKVDYYEKKYGFIPKNAMTEAEWKEAKKNGPIVKLPSKLEVTAYHGHHW